MDVQMLPVIGLSPRILRDAYGCFPCGVTAVCALGEDGVPVGMAASAFTSVSLDPPLVSLCVQQSSRTWPQLRDRPRIGLSVLASGHEPACTSLSRKEGDRFAGVVWHRGANGSVFVDAATVWLDCSLEAEHTAGEHAIAVLRLHGVRAWPEVAPLVFHGSVFRRLAAVEPVDRIAS